MLNGVLKSFYNSRNFHQWVRLGIIITIFIFVHMPFGRLLRRYDYIPNDSITEYLVPSRELDSGTCALLPNTSLDILDPIERIDYSENEYAQRKQVNVGGWWAPDHCDALHNVAIIVPYRDRKNQLDVFLYYMHDFLQSQLLSYRIFVIEQSSEKEFNRGKLMNVGFKEAMKIHPFHCFIFHDVDLLPQVMMNVYGCTKRPRHMSSSINVWRYNLLYSGAFGGVSSLLSQQFRQINGFSNVYFGWGGEDDDLLLRVKKNGMEIIRFSPEVSRYFMLPHKKQPKNSDRVSILQAAENRLNDDGLNSIEYQVLSFKNLPLSTHIIVQV